MGVIPGFPSNRRKGNHTAYGDLDHVSEYDTSPSSLYLGNDRDAQACFSIHPSQLHLLNFLYLKTPLIHDKGRVFLLDQNQSQ